MTAMFVLKIKATSRKKKEEDEFLNSDSEDNSLISLEDDEDEDNDEDSDDDLDSNSVNNLLMTPERDEWIVYQTDLYGKDEFSHYKDFILKLKSNQPQLFEMVYSKMNDQSKKFLKNNIQKERIETFDEEVSEPRIIRKINRPPKYLNKANENNMG